MTEFILAALSGALVGAFLTWLILSRQRSQQADTFNSLAAQALQANSQGFLQLAQQSMQGFQERAKGDLDQRTQAVQQLVKPIQDSLGKVDEKLAQLEKETSPQPEKVISNVALRRPMDMTRDGRYVFYRMNSPDLWALDQQTKQEISIIRPNTAPTHWPRVSADGRWIAVQSYSSGSMQVHLHGPFAPPALGTTSKPLTTNGGGWPVWRGDGKELFYVEADGTLMSISLSYSGDGNSFTASNPVKLFTPPINSSPVNTGAGAQFAVTPDGQRFLVITSPDVENPVHLHGD